MQTAPATFVVPPPQNGYQPLSEAEIYAIKRQYLGLLPPQQIIDICLTFEAHAPLHVKCSVWPYDIRAAIASIQAQKAQTSQTQSSPEPDAPLKTPAPESSPRENTVQPPQSSLQQSASATPSSSTSSVSQPVASQSQVSPASPGPHYPHQPYYHSTYPHAPYYTAPHAPYGYPHPFPPYLQAPTLYSANPAGHHPPLFTHPPLAHPPHLASEVPPPLDDLPSYEEMIVEALLDSGDPEGCAPKNLFGWMAMHYPLQMNFRPSASQALQKAYKRGRLEKGSNGKYRLNENWEGGNTSRRTTRRPQTLAQTALPGPQPPSSSPFTHTPLIPHGTTNLPTRFPPPGQPPGYGVYPYGYPYHGLPGSTPALVSQGGLGITLQKQAVGTIEHETGEGSDVWEAAQNILKAINFGQLTQVSNEEDKAGEPSTSASSVNQQIPAGGPDNLSLASGAMNIDDFANARLDDTGKSPEQNAEQRAALQAQLVLLAAQLAELADVSEDRLSHNLEAPQQTSDASTSQVLGDGSDDEDNEDMIEIQVPMTSLTA